ncbi:MAG: PIN domain-containing protein, partial [Terriglobales bacterium]
VQVTPTMVFDAIDGAMLDRLSFWDSLLIAAARSANCRELCTEDLQSGQVIRGVTIRNPLLA